MVKRVFVSTFLFIVLLSAGPVGADGWGFRDTPVVTVLDPDGGEFWDFSPHPLDRRVHTVLWSATLGSGYLARVKISYSANGGADWSCVADSDGLDCSPWNLTGSDLLEPDDTSFAWAMPTQDEATADGQDLPSASCRVRVEAWDDSANGGGDDSNANFYIIQPTTTAYETFILWDSGRVETRYGAPDRAALETELNLLKDHDRVNGIVLDLALLPAVQDAYTCWDECYDGDGCMDLAFCPVASYDPQVRADALAEEIRAAVHDLILTAYTNVDTLVLVGNDEQIPFYRIGEGILVASETDYPPSVSMDVTHTVGSALDQDYYLTDSFYSELTPEDSGLPAPHDLLYFNDLAIGRLVETPAQVVGVIDTFLAADGVVDMTDSFDPQLVTGFGASFDSAFAIRGAFVSDGRSLDCHLDNPLGSGSMIPCIDKPYSPDDLELSLFSGDPYSLSLVGNGANHYSLEASVPFGATDVLFCTDSAYDAAACYVNGMDDHPEFLTGSIMVAGGDHGGLTVPSSDARPLDLPEMMSDREVLGHIGSTGYNWIAREGKAYTERITEDLVDEFLGHVEIPIGRALANAKRRTFQETKHEDIFSLKALHGLTLFGIPNTVMMGAAWRDAEPADEGWRVMRTLSDARSGAHVPPGVVELELDFEFIDVYDPVTEATGDYYTMNGISSVKAGQTVQPMLAYYSDLGGFEARGVIFDEGTLQALGAFDPVVARPFSSGDPSVPEASAPPIPTFLPVLKLSSSIDSSPFRADGLTVYTTLNVETGYYREGEEFLFDTLGVTIYYGNSTDSKEPTIVDPAPDDYHRVNGLGADFEVEVTDDLGVFRVVVVWYDPMEVAWFSQDLAYNGVSGLWEGFISFRGNVLYFVEAVNDAGRATMDTVSDDLPFGGPSDYCIEGGCVYTGPRLFEVLLEDLDLDTIPDAWEDLYACVDSGVDDRSEDPDEDLLDNLGEYEADTDPCSPDTDGGYDNDGSEVNNGRDPLDPLDDLALTLEVTKDAVEGTYNLCWPDPGGSNGVIDGPYHVYRATMPDFFDGTRVHGPLGDGTTCQPDTPPCDPCFYRVYNVERTFATPPQVDVIVPPNGPAAGGTPVNVYGENFLDGATVDFCGTPAVGVTWMTENWILCTTPGGPAGGCDVTVTNPDLLSDTLVDGFLYE